MSVQANFIHNEKHTVIPAKAGIQQALLQEVASWIPAFAGMTGT
jgi:hypothetical protein